ncbi:NAD-dependent epimerase/dehydratase family protein [Vibrio sp. CyArs1]|uniref:UDP-2-acetamido-2,6-beta-L-arabino-hexul-4-ose reductase n=1 Tax=Vibrio sp. CyArs1 TaxID=2682577 RepID=UPI001F0610D9|nr:NAD-dependent epimerase/dehydratase family protein [Vibrio sp. CyArs1]
MNLTPSSHIVVTGAHGFIGKNLCTHLRELGYDNIVEVTRKTAQDEFKGALSKADFIFHLAGVNRPKDPNEFEAGNTSLTQFIVSQLEQSGRKTPIVLSSSTQAELDNPYGASKSDAEKLVVQYGEATGAHYSIFRLPNVFGKWCRPNYNSFVATFCHNIVNALPIQINERSSPVSLVYIDDVCNEFSRVLTETSDSGYKTISKVYDTTVGEVADALYSFRDAKTALLTERVGAGLTRALYATYLSYYRPEQFAYSIPSYTDERGTFCEMLKTKDSGQFSFFTAHPGVTRGGHYHHTKNEKFLVIKGQAVFRFKNIITGETHTIETSGDCPKVVETVPGWSHDVTNSGSSELVVMLWANEIFDRNKPDTIASPIS